MLVQPFPPSFDGNPWTYGLALFSLTLISSLSLAQILAYAFETRREREIDRQVRNALPPPPPQAPMSTLTAFRRIIFGFLVMAFLGACPDVFILLGWNEVERPTMEVFYLIDRVGDGMAMIPFLSSFWLLARTRQALPQQLAKVVHIPLAAFQWGMMRDSVRIVGIVLLISVGVTIGKASV